MHSHPAIRHIGRSSSSLVSLIFSHKAKCRSIGSIRPEKGSKMKAEFEKHQQFRCHVRCKWLGDFQEHQATGSNATTLYLKGIELASWPLKNKAARMMVLKSKVPWVKTGLKRVLKRRFETSVLYWPTLIGKKFCHSYRSSP